MLRERIENDLKFVSQIGATLSPRERLGLELALLKLEESEHFDQVFFWGRIEAINCYYYLALGLSSRGHYDFPQKSFFWCTEDFQFSSLPTPLWEHAKEVFLMRQAFTGMQELILIRDIQPARQVAAGVTLPAKHFTELDRLSLVVHSIEHDCQIAPLGAFKMIPTHEILRNAAFRGLSSELSQQLSSFVHFRPPESKDKKALIASDEALSRLDFLDEVQEDTPRGQWSIQHDEFKLNFTVRSLLWPGYVAYSRANSNLFGACFMGEGIKCIDLPFII